MCCALIAVGPFAVIQSPKIRTVNESDNVSLTCDASGIPDPTIKWTKVGESHVLYVGPTYTIVNISRVAGNTVQYQCSVSNGVQSPVYDRANITVQCEYFGCEKCSNLRGFRGGEDGHNKYC